MSNTFWIAFFYGNMRRPDLDLIHIVTDCVLNRIQAISKQNSEFYSNKSEDRKSLTLFEASFTHTFR